jgi:hypothetical protein
MDSRKQADMTLSEEDFFDQMFFDQEQVVSATECTGLIPTPPQSAEQAESYAQLYHIPQSKDQPNSSHAK